VAAAMVPCRLAVLSARYAHVPGHRRAVVATIDDEIVALRLAADRLVNRLFQFGVGRARPQNAPQVGIIVLPEAHIQCPGAGQPDTVTALAEIVCHWRDEAAPAARPPHVEVPRGPAGAIIGL